MSARFTFKGFVSVTFLLLIFSIKSFSQSSSIHIGGQVTDTLTSSALPGATVYITNLNSGIFDSTQTSSTGYWSYDLAVTSVGDDNSTLPSQFSVSQNYPNPFNPSTRIDVALPEAGNVKVGIYNALGQEIETLEEYLEKGNYTLDWNAKGNAGVYFINIKSGRGDITKKMILLDHVGGTGLSHFRSSGKVNHNTVNRINKIGASIPVLIQTSKFGYIPYVKNVSVSGGESFQFIMASGHSRSTVVDLHNDVLEVLAADTSYHLADFHSKHHTDIPRLKAGGVDIQMFSVWVDPDVYKTNAYSQSLKLINMLKSEIAKNPNSIGQASTKDEALALNRSNKIAAVMIVEGGHSIENDLEKLKTFYLEGMRYFTITWNNSTSWAVSAKDSLSPYVGLSEFGKQVIRTLDSLGVIIDVSHTGIKTIGDILEVTKNPIIASHSGAWKLCNHYRNLTDDQIQAIAKSGGVIGVDFYPPFLVRTGAAYISTVANHIDYIVKLAGVDYVALGSDFDGIERTVVGLENVSKFPDLTLELLRRGYSVTDINKILGGNFLRVFEKVCGVPKLPM